MIQQAMKTDTDAAIKTFGKNWRGRKVFRTVFVAMAGPEIARVVDPVTTQQIDGAIAGIGGNTHSPTFLQMSETPESGS